MTEVAPMRAPAPLREAIGIDLGLAALATPTHGEPVANPRWLRQRQAALRRAQRALSRKRKGSSNRERARRAVARLHVARRRRAT